MWAQTYPNNYTAPGFRDFRSSPRIASSSGVNGITPVKVKRVVRRDHASGAVRRLAEHHAGEREVKIALRKALFKYMLRQDQGQFERAYGYIKEYY